MTPTPPQRQLPAFYGSAQGHILAQHRRQHMWHYLLRFRPGQEKAAGSVLKQVLPFVRSATELFREDSASRIANPAAFLGFTSTGLSKLGTDDSRFGPVFQDGFRKRAESNFGMSTSAWRDEWKRGRMDAIAAVAAADTNQFDTIHQALSSQAPGVLDFWIEKGEVRPSPIFTIQGDRPPTEHFGFVDGISQPRVRQNASEPGHDPSVFLIKDPLASDAEFGSFLAYLRIEQHPKAFQQLAAARAKKSGGLRNTEEEKERLIGRRANGDSLVQGANGLLSNSFARADDPSGKEWPQDSHIAKMNPRDGRSLNTRILRRAIPYVDGDEVGLLFSSFQASLSLQFEEILVHWGMSPHFPVANVGVDPLFDKDLKLTTILGGEYFYFPSIPGLEKLLKTEG